MQNTNAGIFKDFRHNFAVNMVDGSFFGFGMGLASTVSVLPLFLATLTDSTTLIGLIASVHLIGWQLPQLFMAKRVAQRRRFLPMVLWMTIQERWPFLGLAAVAMLTGSMPAGVALLLVYFFYGWHSIGAGLTAPAWQSMVGKIMPVKFRGTFYGMQSAGFSLFGALGALIAGWLIENVAYPVNFALAFVLTVVMMSISWVFLALTREPESAPITPDIHGGSLWLHLRSILGRDINFRWFLLARASMLFTLIGMNFYTIFAVRRYELNAEIIGLMTGVLMISQTVVNPIAGWLGDRIGHRMMFIASALAFLVANSIAMTATDPNWLYLVFALAGAGNSVFFTSMLTLTLTFGKEHERPYYIGLGNTLLAPITLGTPLLGGLIVDVVSYEAMFGLTIAAAIFTVLVLVLRVRDEKQHHEPRPSAELAPVGKEG